jgi:hypothetical protein
MENDKRVAGCKGCKPGRGAKFGSPQSRHNTEKPDEAEKSNQITVSPDFFQRILLSSSITTNVESETIIDFWQ